MRLVSYNIHKGIGGSDRRYRLDRIVDVLRDLDADLLCLQEVTIDLPRTGRHDQATLLSEQFAPMEPAFQQNVHWRVGGYGNLVLSRWPLRERHRIALRFEAKKPRGAQLLVVETPHGPLRFTNWHLGLSEAERHWQTRHLLAHPTFAATDAHPTLLCGDSNDWRNTLGKDVLQPRGFMQATSPPGRFRSFPAALPVLALDKVFHCERVVVDATHLVRTKAARQASDHLPLVIDFRLRGAAHGS